MKRFTFALIVLAFAVTSHQAQAAEPDGKPNDLRRASITVSGTLSPTPEMWLYEQERLRSEDPDLYRLNVAQKKAMQRRQRLAAKKWYGISGTRPPAMGLRSNVNSVYTWGQSTYRRGLWTGTRMR